MNKNNKKSQPQICFFCVNNIKQIDYKDTENLEQFTGGYKKIFSRKRTKVCAKHQRKLGKAIKLARIMALMPFTNR